MGWFDEYFQEDTPADSGGADINANLGSDLGEALQIALGDNASQDWITQSISAYSDYRNTAESQRMYDPPKSESDKSPKKEQGLIGKLSSFVDKNKELSAVLLKGVAAAASSAGNKSAAEVQARSRLDELKLKNQQEREKDAQVSASVSGLRAPTGLIGRPQRQLQRIDGTPVFTNGRIV